MTLLYRRQKRMKWLEAMDMDRPILEELEKNPRVEAGIFDNARQLAVYPENRDSLNVGRYFIEKMIDKLEELIVHAHFRTLDDESPSRDAISVRELNDTATGPGLLTSTLFGHFMPFDECMPFQNLTSLRLHRISLRYCADTWCKFVNFNKMRYLRIYHCPGVDSLLGQLTRAANLPKSLHVFELQHKDNAEDEALIALEGFLCLVSGLRSLVIDLQNVKTLPAVAGMVRHSKTLERLNIHCSNDTSSPLVGDRACDAEELVYEAEDFEKICSTATRLEQLSLAWPNRSLIRSPSDDWCAFENSICKLRQLVTLHITTWPSNKKASSSTLSRSIYEYLLQGVATRLFEMSAKRLPLPEPVDAASTPASPPTPSKFRLVAFGISDKIYEREDSRNQLLYLRSSALDAEGKFKIYATPVGWCLRKYLEPRSDVLDFVLSREARLPCRAEIEDMDRFGFTVDDD